MKPNNIEETDDRENNSINGDAIGDTAYSERFVLKLLLKLTNLDTLKCELQETTIEDDFCTLWDMAAERDVVLFLLKHDALNLFNFAWSVLESPRLVEITVGIIGNMCCQKEAIEKLLSIEPLIQCILDYVKCDDSLIIIQLLRLVNSSLFLSEDCIDVWMKLFIETDYATALFFILKNSSNKDLLVTALENFNTICAYCNVEKCCIEFFNHFVTKDAIVSLSAAFTEIINFKELCQLDEFERMLLITLQVILNLVGFDKSPEIYNNDKVIVLKIISYLFTYYETKFVNQKEIDMDLLDVVDSSQTIIKCLNLCENCNNNDFFLQGLNIWQTLLLTEPENENSFEAEDSEELKTFFKQIKVSLSCLLLTFLDKCSQKDLLIALDVVGSHFEDISKSCNDTSLVTSVTKKASDYRTRLKEIENC